MPNEITANKNPGGTHLFPDLFLEHFVGSFSGLVSRTFCCCSTKFRDGHFEGPLKSPKIFIKDFPARSVIEVSALPMDANIEIDAVAVIK